VTGLTDEDKQTPRFGNNFCRMSNDH